MKRGMKISVLLVLVLILCVCNIQAEIIWDSGHHEVTENESYDEIIMLQDATLDVLGGTVGTLADYDDTLSNIFGGEILEMWMSNNATANIFGGEIFKLETLDFSVANIFDGGLNDLTARNNSSVNIYGGDFLRLGAYEDSFIYLYAYDVVYHETGGGSHGDDPWLEGRYYSDNNPFSFDLWGEEVYSHITIVPEPATILLFGLGASLLRRRS